MGEWRYRLGQLWHGTLIVAWCALVLAIVLLTVRYVATGQLGTAQPALSASTRDSLKVVIAPQKAQHIGYGGFEVLFNPDWREPWCVTYELTRLKTHGNVPRYDKFERDSVVARCASPKDYALSGFERGHMAAAADFHWDSTAMRRSFKMTNVCPQVQALNSGGWHRLEQKVRQWAVRDSAILVFTGPIVGKRHRTIGKGKVAVPRAFFKIVMAPYAHPLRVIAFVYPNAEANGPLRSYAVSVDEVERLTGLDFFSYLPAQVEHGLESQCHLNPWLMP